MFTGIIEDIGKVVNVKRYKSNIDFEIESSFHSEIAIDQSISHNGVCLTVTNIGPNSYSITAINETLNKSNLQNLNIGDYVNLERCMRLSDRLDGHIVQGHVDTVATCTKLSAENGSWRIEFSFDPKFTNLVIPKGSISVNGVSLTVVDPTRNMFKVAIIPYTYNHTIFRYLKIGETVNIEFDILGKYIEKHIISTEWSREKTRKSNR